MIARLKRQTGDYAELSFYVYPDDKHADEGTPGAHRLTESLDHYSREGWRPVGFLPELSPPGAWLRLLMERRPRDARADLRASAVLESLTAEMLRRHMPAALENCARVAADGWFELYAKQLREAMKKSVEGLRS